MSSKKGGGVICEYIFTIHAHPVYRREFILKTLYETAFFSGVRTMTSGHIMDLV